MIVVLLFIVFIIIMVGKKDDKRIIEKSGLSEITKIKYDKKTVKYAFVLMLLFGVITVFFISMLFLDTLISSDLTILYVLTPFSIPLFLITCIVWIDGKIYLNALSKWGYEIPYDASEYDKILEKLPKKESEFVIEARSRFTVVISILEFVTGIAFSLYAITFAIDWRYVDVVFPASVMIIISICWMIKAFLSFKSSDNALYRDEFNLDYSKKKRAGLGEKIITFLILLGISFFVANVFLNMTKYVFRARIDKDTTILTTIECAAQKIYDENSDSISESWKESYELLQAGTDVFALENVNDLFSEQLIEEITYDSYEDIRNEITIPDTKFYIRIVDGDIQVRYYSEIVAKKYPFLVDEEYR